MLSWLGSDKTKSKSIRTRALPLRIILLSIATWAYICVDSLSADNSAYAHSSTIWCTLSIILSSHLLSSHLSSHPALYPLIYSSNYTSHGSETSMDALPPSVESRGVGERSTGSYNSRSFQTKPGAYYSQHFDTGCFLSSSK